MRVDRRYYLVGEGPVMDVIRRAEERHQAFRDAITALHKEFAPAQIWVSNDAKFLGIDFGKDTPEGWGHNKRDGYARPDKRTGIGRALAQRFESFPVGVDSWVFADMLGGKPWRPIDSEAHRMYFTYFECYGEKYVLCVPNVATVEPAGCKLLKTSEYWALREAHEAAMGVNQ